MWQLQAERLYHLLQRLTLRAVHNVPVALRQSSAHTSPAAECPETSLPVEVPAVTIEPSPTLAVVALSEPTPVIQVFVAGEMCTSARLRKE